MSGDNAGDARPDREELDERREDVSVQGFEQAAKQVSDAIIAVVASAIVAFHVLATFAIVAAGPIFFVYVVLDSDPGEIAPDADAGYLDLVFSNRWVIWMARVMLYVAGFTLLVLGIYICGSMFTRIKNREWLRSAGGFHADVRQIQSDMSPLDDLLDLLDEAQDEKDRLANQLVAVTDELEAVTAERDDLMARAIVLEREALERQIEN
jgi:hypothetical protein